MTELDRMANIERWPTGENDMVPGPAYDRMRAEKDRLRELYIERESEIDGLTEQLRGAVRLLDEFDRYASVDDGTPYAGSPFAAEVRAFLDAAGGQ